MSKLFDIPLAVFDPDNLLEQMKNAKDGDVFVIDQKNTPNPEGDDSVELTIAQIKRVRDSQL